MKHMVVCLGAMHLMNTMYQALPVARPVDRNAAVARCEDLGQQLLIQDCISWQHEHLHGQPFVS